MAVANKEEEKRNYLLNLIQQIAVRMKRIIVNRISSPQAQCQPKEIIDMPFQFQITLEINLLINNCPPDNNSTYRTYMGQKG